MGPSLFIGTVPALECSSGPFRFCGIGVAKGLAFRPLKFRIRCLADAALWPPILASAQSGVCEIPAGVP